MSITRDFTIYLNAGISVPPVVHVNQYDQGEIWRFTLLEADSSQYTPSSGALIGVKSDGHAIAGVTGTVLGDGRVQITETQQMTAAAGDAIFELTIDGQTHGTANFIVRVEKKPTDDAILSDSDLSIIQQGIDQAERIAQYGSPLVAASSSQMTNHQSVYVYTGTTTASLTNGHWYYWNGSAWEDGGVYNSVAVTTDKTLTQVNVAADAKATGDAVSDLKTEIEENVLFSVTSQEADWQQGFYGVTYGTYAPNNNNAICVVNNINKDVYKLSCTSAYKMRLQAWDSSNAYVGSWSGTVFTDVNPNYYLNEINFSYFFKTYPSYSFKVCLFKDDGTSEVGVSDASYVTVSYSLAKELDGVVSRVGGSFDLTELIEWEVGSINANYGEDFEISYGLRSKNSAKLRAIEDMILTTDNTEVLSLFAFKYSRTDGAYIERIGSTGETNDLTLVKGYDYRVLLLFRPQTTITEETIPDYSKNTYVYGKAIKKIVSGNISEADDYVILPSLTRLPVIIKRLGTLNGTQSFCKYNGHYYSTDGSNLYEQDETFTLVSTTPMTLGHGNSMQLGQNGVAYVSGWDDGKIYIVNLATKTVTGNITLPMTGYTTGVVDEVNKLAYIFQRESRPNTEENYNFIVYDYDNQEVVRTIKTTNAFGALQSCDIIDGKIFALNGLGTNELPNGYRIYDTLGDVISEYVFGTMSSIEPEGIFIDRNTKEIEISFGTTLYSVRQRLIAW